MLDGRGIFVLLDDQISESFRFPRNIMVPPSTYRLPPLHPTVFGPVACLGGPVAWAAHHGSSREDTWSSGVGFPSIWERFRDSIFGRSSGSVGQNRCLFSCLFPVWTLGIPNSSIWYQRDSKNNMSQESGF